MKRSSSGFLRMGLFFSLASVLFLPGWSETTRTPLTLTVSGRREPDEAIVGTKAMHYLPFTVPEGATRITIHREFDHGPDATRKNTVDFGLFDQRGNQNGFRGWQGGSPGDFTITGDALTCSPHAVPGPLKAGTWLIAQYYLVSVPAGLNYTYTITIDFDGPKPPDTIPTPPRYEPGIVRNAPGWYAGNMHVHSLHSDGGRTFSEMVGHCAAAGFDFIASTEHNSTTAHYRLAEAGRKYPNTLLLYGDEFTSPGGHANIIGQKPGYWFDFRMDPGDKQLPDIFATAHRQGAFVTVNHPFAICTSCSWRYPETEWKDADAIEVWNGKWTPDDRLATNLWDRLLKEGHHFVAVGGTDYHRGDDALTPATLVYARNLSQSAILKSLRKGSAYITESPQGPKLLLHVREGLPKPTPNTSDVIVSVSGGKGMTLRLIWNTGELSVPIATDEETVTQNLPIALNTPNDYVRAELQAPDGSMKALTNPLYGSKGNETTHEN